MAAIGPRRPRASGVIRQGLGLAVVTPLPTRQISREQRRHFRQVAIDWRPQGPERTYGAGGAGESTAPGGEGLGLNDCAGCE